MPNRTLIALLVLLAAFGPANAIERILVFVSDVQVARNGDLTVAETIKVQVEGKDIRRGILREIPTVYTRSNGTRGDAEFETLSVARNGSAENYSTERLPDAVRIRIGDPNRLLTNGPHEYTIRYRTTRQIRFFPDFDELYWNATGTGWTFQIDEAEARITLPERAPFRQSAFYTGPHGARDKDASVLEQQPGRIVFRTIKVLPPQNGLTIAAAWAKGVVLTPEDAEAAARRAVRASFISEFSIQTWASEETLIVNPFPYKDKVVGVRADFDQMLSSTEARFGRILVSDVPSTRFTVSGKPIVLAFKVSGLKPFMFLGTNMSLPFGRFVGAYSCTKPSCSDFFDN